MRVPAERRAARGDLFLFSGCLLLALIALALPRPWVGGLSAVLRASLFRPLVILQERAALDRTARLQLPAIEIQRDSFARLVQDQATVALENRNLRGLLALGPRIGVPFRPAELLHQSSNVDDRMLLLGIGARQGVDQFDPVVTPDGLLGYVWNSEPESAMVLTWLHPEFRAHAVTEDGAVVGMVAPARVSATLTLLELRGVALRDTLMIGTRVYTSSLGAVYPRGIPIGTIIGSTGDSLSYERIYRVAPFVNPGTATHALVLDSPRGASFLPLPSEVKRAPDSSARSPLGPVGRGP